MWLRKRMFCEIQHNNPTHQLAFIGWIVDEIHIVGLISQIYWKANRITWWPSILQCLLDWTANEHSNGFDWKKFLFMHAKKVDNAVLTDRVSGSYQIDGAIRT